MLVRTEMVTWLNYTSMSVHCTIEIDSTITTKYFCILVPAPSWHFCSESALFGFYLGQICIVFGANLALFSRKNLPKLHFLKLPFMPN